MNLYDFLILSDKLQQALYLCQFVFHRTAAQSFTGYEESLGEPFPLNRTDSPDFIIVKPHCVPAHKFY